MSKRKLKLLRIVAMVMLISIVNQIIFPTVAMALTSSTQPEVYGYQPVDATDNVSLGTGNFNYTIPITSIPEFPMAIGYNAGLGMDHEASVFGFGFNGFSGAITRAVNGLPDDLNGANKQISFKNEVYKDFSFTSGATLGYAVGSVGIGARAGLTRGYNTYNGAYGAISLGIGAGAGLAGNFLSPAVGAGVGAQFTVDTREKTPRFSAGASIGLSISAGVDGAGINTSTGLGMGIYATRPINSGNAKWQTGGNVLNKQFVSSKSPLSTQPVSSSTAPLAYVFPDKNGSSTQFSVNAPLIVIPVSVDVGISASKFSWDENVINKSSYGFMNLSNYDRSDVNSIADMSIERENSFSESEFNSPCYLQKDNYSINTMGVSGGIEIYQSSYGVVSRNTSQEITKTKRLLNTNVKKEQVKPWVAAKQTSSNKSADVLALVRRPQNADQLFNEETRVNMNQSNNRFNDNSTVFKMRGDYAGQYDLGSKNYTDHDVSPFTLEPVQGTSHERKIKFLGIETSQLIKYPAPTVDYDGYTASHSIERGTNIIKHTIGDILAAAGATNINKDPNTDFNFSQSFYSHENYLHHNTNKSATDVMLKTDVEKMNILKHLNNMAGRGSYVNSLIGSMEVQSGNGLRYFFNLPVFNLFTRATSLMGKDNGAPESAYGDYYSYNKGSSDYRDRNKMQTTENFIHPYAWLLTAVVGDDYIDFDNIPGPSDGDIGYWVKFKYVKASDNYNWRSPFTGMDHNPMILDKPDDSYSVVAGQKEVYYLSEVESSNYKCNYQYQKRFDGMDAAGYWNGDAVNTLKELPSIPSDPTGSNFQFAVTQIDLYKKHTNGANSDPVNISSQLIKSTLFYYDYSTSSNVPNNLTTYVTNINLNNLSYYDNSHSAGTTGKLTLRKVQHVAYDEAGTTSYLPSYEFNYYGDDNAIYNPPYDGKAHDQWGNYMKGAASVNGNGITYYHHYTEYVKDKANENAKVFKLKSISLPSGGTMEVDYQAQSYGFVEDQPPYIMRHVNNVMPVDADHTKLIVDISDIDIVNHPNGLASDNNLKPGDRVYGEIAFFRSTSDLSPANTILIAEEAIVSSIDQPVTAFNKIYQHVTVQRIMDGEHPGKPFIAKCEDEMYFNSIESQAMADAGVIPNGIGGCALVEAYKAKLEQDSKGSIFTVGPKMLTHFIKTFQPQSSKQTQFDNCFGHPGSISYEHWSFLRTPIYKAKYTGAVVKSITLRDGFRYATQATGGESDYGTVYYYDVNGDGSGRSAGVATNEPGGGKINVLDNYSRTGAGFAAAPTILCSKITLENLYHAGETAATANGAVVSRKKGKTSYEFYTPKDPGLQFANNFKSNTDYNNQDPLKGKFFLFGIFTWKKIRITKKRSIRIPKIKFLILKWKLEDKYHLKSYAYTDYTDMFGKLKAVQQIDASGKEMGSQHYNYYGIDEAVPVYANNFSAPVATIQKPGKVDQVWSEAFYTRRDDINRYVKRILVADTKKDFSYTNMKYSYIPTMLKEVSSTIDGLTTKTRYTGFDYYTGSPIEVKSEDSYNNTKISRTEPAYWRYPEMGPASVNGNNINNLTATTRTYMYLNSTASTNLIGAGVVQWASGQSGKWKMVSYLQPLQNYVAANTIRYTYTEVSGNTIKSAYSAAAKSNDVFPKIKRNASIYKPYKGYTYEVPLETDGRFKSFVEFNYTNLNANSTWKELSTNELYAQNGVLVQSKDVLGKYAAQLLGYNFSNTIGAVSNASFGGCAFDGAENTYATSAGALMLEGNKVKLGDAKAVKACENTTFMTRSFYCKDLSLQSSLHKLTVTLPATPNYNVPFAKINVKYNGGSGLVRTLYLSVNDNKEIEIVSNKGEVFQGFLVYPQAANTYQLYFKNSDFATAGSFVLDNTYTNNATVSYTANQSLPGNCECTTKSYSIPGNDCDVHAHTGEYAFVLEPTKMGTSFSVTTFPAVSGNVTLAELRRKYKALVWVHNSSPDNTQLVVQLATLSGSIISEQTTSKATPYAKAGDWTLLRVDFDLSNQPSNVRASVFVRNMAAAPTLWNANYDDLRVLPYHADMTNWVFDHQFNRVLSGLDVDNFASYSGYDSRGRVTKSAVEIQNDGKKTVQKFLYNDQKKQ
jgi:hypothetical protein